MWGEERARFFSLLFNVCPVSSVGDDAGFFLDDVEEAGDLVEVEGEVGVFG